MVLTHQIITSLEELLLPTLREWWGLHRKWPRNVLYYRDGVSTSQYDEVIEKELPGISAAFNKLAEELKQERAPDFKLTAVIVTKRHSTRFFPTKQQDAMPGNENTLPGTLVDSIVTHPYYTDFYLQSHNGIKGTARPAHYFVLKNEMAMTMQQLQDLVSPFFQPLSLINYLYRPTASATPTSAPPSGSPTPLQRITPTASASAAAATCVPSTIRGPPTARTTTTRVIRKSRLSRHFATERRARGARRRRRKRCKRTRIMRRRF
jgi:hypothetical protein